MESWGMMNDVEFPEFEAERDGLPTEGGEIL